MDYANRGGFIGANPWEVDARRPTLDALTGISANSRVNAGGRLDAGVYYERLSAIVAGAMPRLVSSALSALRPRW